MPVARRRALFSAQTWAFWDVRVAGMAPSCPRAKRIGRRGFGRVFNVWGKCGETHFSRPQGKEKGPESLIFRALWYAPRDSNPEPSGLYQQYPDISHQLP